MAGTLFVVATPIGNLEDVTARALRVLREVALIAAEDTRRTAHLLTRYGIVTPTTSFHTHNEEEKRDRLLGRLTAGDSIAVVSDAGTPTVSDPGQRLIRAALAAGIRVEPVPGPSAITAALAASGIPAGAFTFLGFPPVRPKDRNEWFAALRSLSNTAVFFEAPTRIRSTLLRILQELGDCHMALARELTKSHEELVVGPISSVLKRFEPRGEFTVVIEIGQLANLPKAAPVSDEQLAEEFASISAAGTWTRRQVITELSRRYGRPPNDVYRAIERGRKLVE